MPKRPKPPTPLAKALAKERAALNGHQEAFPSAPEQSGGLTKREHIAAILMAAWISRHASVLTTDTLNQEAADRAVVGADLLLNALEKP